MGRTRQAPHPIDTCPALQEKPGLILRYAVECPGCMAKIVLRLGVGVDTQLPFYYVCGKCGVPTRGVLHTRPDTMPPRADLELEDGRIFDQEHEDADQVITISLDLPCLLVGDEASPEGMFPFFHQAELMGGLERLMEFQRRMGMFRQLIMSDWTQLRRLITYYADRNWGQFDVELQGLFDERQLPPRNDLDRHDLFHRAVELFFLPLLPDFEYPDLKAEFNGFLLRLMEERKRGLREFTICLANSPELAQYQCGLLDRLSFCVDHFPALAPGFPVLFYTEEGERSLERLRIMRDDFEILKSHYLSCFEACHRILFVLIGLINLSVRGNADAFAGGSPGSLAQFERLPNAEKVKYLDKDVLPAISSRWQSSLDRQLRNAIGHYGIHHDLRTGLLVRQRGEPIPYSQFVASNLKLIPMLLYCIQVVKMIYINRWFYDQESGGSSWLAGAELECRRRE